MSDISILYDIKDGQWTEYTSKIYKDTMDKIAEKLWQDMWGGNKVVGIKPETFMTNDMIEDGKSLLEDKITFPIKDIIKKNTNFANVYLSKEALEDIKGWDKTNQSTITTAAPLDKAINSLKFIIEQNKLNNNNTHVLNPSFNINPHTFQIIFNNIELVLKHIHQYRTAKILGKTLDEWINDSKLLYGDKKSNVIGAGNIVSVGDTTVGVALNSNQTGEFINVTDSVATGNDNLSHKYKVGQKVRIIKREGDYGSGHVNFPRAVVGEEIVIDSICSLFNTISLIYYKDDLFCWIPASWVEPLGGNYEFLWKPLKNETQLIIPDNSSYINSNREHWQECRVSEAFCKNVLPEYFLTEVEKYIGEYEQWYRDEPNRCWVFLRPKIIVPLKSPEPPSILHGFESEPSISL